jgi:hypothetical protein
MSMIVASRLGHAPAAIAGTPEWHFSDNYNKDSYLNEADMNS